MAARFPPFMGTLFPIDLPMPWAGAAAARPELSVVRTGMILRVWAFSIFFRCQVVFSLKWPPPTTSTSTPTRGCRLPPLTTKLGAAIALAPIPSSPSAPYGILKAVALTRGLLREQQSSCAARRTKKVRPCFSKHGHWWHDQVPCPWSCSGKLAARHLPPQLLSIAMGKVVVTGCGTIC